MDSILKTLVTDVFIPIIILFTVILFAAIALIVIFAIVGLILYKKGNTTGNNTQTIIGIVFFVLAGIITLILSIMAFRIFVI